MAATRKSAAMGPSVRSLLSQYQLEPNRINPSGPHQTILKCDVVRYIAANKLQPKMTHLRYNDKAGSDDNPRANYKPTGLSQIAKKLLDGL